MIDAVATEQPGSAARSGAEPDSGDPVRVEARAAATGVGEAAGTPGAESGTGFSVRLEEFEGPFDLLLSLIAKHRLDVTVLALHTVIDDFLAHIRARGPEWDLDEATEFLVVAATLLDLKAARLLPSGEVEDEEDLALLEARDILFARLLQYRAYKDVSAVLGELLRTGSRRHPREVGLDPEFSGLLPEVLIGLGPLEFAALAARALAPKPVPQVGVGHIHAVRVSVREQAAILVDRLRRHPSATFRSLTSDCDTTLLVVARFLALLELYRDGSVAFDQVSPLGELHVRWTGAAEGEVVVRAEEYEGAPPASGEPRPAEEVDLAAIEEALGRPPRDGGPVVPEDTDVDISDNHDITDAEDAALTSPDPGRTDPAGSTEEPR
ncbi:MAG: segregation/condensation protein A [Actinomycetales bacterium]|nr:segregation/condensation protein A [Actinomycetales bacterium]